MVVAGGVNIDPGEIEGVLHAIPGVHDCAVFGIPDDEFGEALMAVVEPEAGLKLDVADIRVQLKTSLADYKVPKHVEIQTQLPREDSGKIFKRRLRDPYWERAGRRISGNSSWSGAARAPPRTMSSPQHPSRRGQPSAPHDDESARVA